MRIVVEAQLDEQGDREEFSWDLFPLISARQTLHLRRDGLPRVGTVLVPGMIIVGKIGKSKNCEPHRRPTALETEGLDEAAIRERYGAFWYDACVYADESNSGIVTAAHLDMTAACPTAVVEIDGSAKVPREKVAANR